MKRFFILMTIAAFQLPGLFAQSMDLDAAREAALAKSASVKAATFTAQSAGLSKTIAVDNLMPSLSAVSSISTTLDNPGGNLTTPSLSVSASGTIFAGGSKVLAVRSADRESARAGEALRSARMAAIENLDTLYLSALKSAKNAEAATKDLEAAARTLELATAKKTAGSLSEVDFLEAQSTWATKKTSATAASYAAQTARRKLSSAVGKAIEPVAIADDRWAPLIGKLREKSGAEAEALVAALYAEALKRNPELKADALAVDIARIAEASNLSNFLPTVSASMGTAFGGSSSATTLERTSLSVSASIAILPLGGRLASQKKAQLATDSARETWTAAGEDVALSLYTNLLDLLSAADQIETAKMALAYAERNETLVQEKVKLSSATLSDLADAEATLSTARYQYISASFTEYTALLELSRLAGFENEGELLNALQ